MKKIHLIIINLLFGFSLMAQYDLQYTQFYFNKLAFNPAYAGSREALTFGATYRHQWAKIDGAPRTMSGYIHAPFWQKRSGVGLAVTSDRIGYFNVTNVTLSYAYRVQVGDNGRLGLGLSGRLENGRVDWTKVTTTEIGDNSLPGADEAVTSPNFGAGLFYSNPNFYIGFSVPQLLRNTYLQSDYYNANGYGQFRTYYLMAGVVAKLSNNVYFQPSAMASFNSNAPFDLDLNATFLFNEVLWLGATYRLGDSIDGVVMYQISDMLKAGVAYDFTISELRQHTTGTFEILMEMTLRKDKENYEHIRFF